MIIRTIQNDKNILLLREKGNCMKKIFFKALVLMLACLLTFGAVSVWGATVTFEAEGGVVKTLEAENGQVVLPKKPEVKNGQFVGWSGTLNGKTFLLPAGAVLEGVTEDLTVTAETLYFATDTASALRIYEGDLGLRFTSTLSLEDYDRLVALVGKDSVAFGTYIVPDQLLKKAGRIFDLEHMAKYGVHQYLDVPAKKFYGVDVENKTATIAGSICNLLEKNRALDFYGCGYMKLTYTNGETATIYADFAYKAIGNSLAIRVFDAYNDRDNSYPNQIIYIEGKVEHGRTSRSPYTVEELDLMKAVMNSVVYVKRILEGTWDYENQEGTYYDSPWVIEEPQYNNATGVNTVIISPAEGHTIDELKAVCLERRYRSMKTDAEFVNKTFRIMDDLYTQVPR